jgi:hypothetical protein
MSTSTVGFPRESRISLAVTPEIVAESALVDEEADTVGMKANPEAEWTGGGIEGGMEA